MNLLLKPDVSVSLLYNDHEHYHDGDSGIDLYCPETITIMPGTLHKIDMKIQCEMISDDKNVSYYLYPRSSIKINTILGLSSG